MIQEEVPLKDYSTFGIGGRAAYFVDATTLEEVKEALAFSAAKKIPYLALGKGSNTLFPDQGFDGLVIHLMIDNLEHIGGGKFGVGAGYSFTRLGTKTARLGFSGLEFASGIPGSVGGAIWMNAGAGGAETKDCLESVRFVTRYGEEQVHLKSELEFSYRCSSFQQMDGVIVGATFQLTPSKSARQDQIDLLRYRTKTQPYDAMSCGCMFRNPEGHSAGALIEQCGLKGVSVGDAQVSPVHANFIINRGEASAEDVVLLVEKVKALVKEQVGIELETEVRAIDLERES